MSDATLAFERYVGAIGEAAALLAGRAADAGLDAPVPTCPRWTVADLVAHQGMVHRWAAGNLVGDDTGVPSKTDILHSIPADRLIAWFLDGAAELVATLGATPPDVAAMVFLKDAPAPRQFWARRQAHETTIHAADAVAAALGRMPSADDVNVPRDIAVDGIDELLTGFFTRGRSKLAEDKPFTVKVSARDADAAWTLYVADERIRTERTAVQDADATFTGAAAQLYLGLWNRGEEITAQGRADVLDRWRKVQRIRWS